MRLRSSTERAATIQGEHTPKMPMIIKKIISKKCHSRSYVTWKSTSLPVRKGFIACNKIEFASCAAWVSYAQIALQSRQVHKRSSSTLSWCWKCDSFPIKILSRLKARDYHIPVLMDTSDKGLIDIERFDLEPQRALFHGLLETEDYETIKISN